MTTDEMLARLASRERWNEILGVSESAQLDFKQIPYKLHLTGAELEVAKFELASDVCAFANAEGGLIVMGIDARGSEANPNDVAREIAQFPFALMDETRVHDIIKQNLSLVPVGLAVRYFPGEASDRGLAAIVIPRQTADAQPFLVRQVIFGQTAKGKAATIGSAIACSRGSKTRTPMTPSTNSLRRFAFRSAFLAN